MKLGNKIFFELLELPSIVVILLCIKLLAMHHSHNWEELLSELKREIRK
jgi:hypothetical protein